MVGRKLPQISSVKNIHDHGQDSASINRGLSRATLELSGKGSGAGTNLSQNERTYIDGIKNK